MRFKVGDWIEHKAYGNGQIIGDDETYWIIRFVEHGEKKMGKKYVELHGHPPYEGFTFPKTVMHKPAKASAKKAISAIPDFDELLERFLSNYPGGLSNASFDEEERIFKDKAVQKFGDLLDRATLADLINGGSFEEVAKRSRQVVSATTLIAIDCCINNAIINIEVLKTYAQAQGERRSSGRSAQARFDVAG